MSNVIKPSWWDKTGINGFGKLLDLAAMRHKLISGNLANATTPGYASQDVDFKGEMDKALGGGQILPMETTSPQHLSNVGPDRQVKVIEHGPESDEDLNGVDVDTEVTNLAVNQMRYTIGARILQKKLEFLREAIKGR
jgi:flagellar basal-body rod protein FlgB